MLMLCVYVWMVVDVYVCKYVCIKGCGVIILWVKYYSKHISAFAWFAYLLYSADVMVANWAASDDEDDDAVEVLILDGKDLYKF